MMPGAYLELISALLMKLLLALMQIWLCELCLRTVYEVG